MSQKRTSVVTLPEVDLALTQWIIQRLHQNVRLTGEVICAKGRYFCQMLGYLDTQLNFSHGWLDRFKTRLGLSSFTFHGDAASASPVHIEGERIRLREILSLYAPWDIYNIDETGLFFRLVPSRGYATRQMSGVKSDKTRITYAFCANMDGSDKRVPLIIGRACRPRCFNGSHGSDMGYNYFWNTKAWMTSPIWNIFLTELNADMQHQGRHILLLCDNAPSHKHDVTHYSNIRIEFLAPNLTAWVQPMDAGIIRCFKAMYKREFIRLAIARDEHSIADIYNISQLQAMELADRAWAMVTPQTIVNCWRHTGICPPQHLLFIEYYSPGVLDSHPNTTLELETALLEQAAGLPHLAHSLFHEMLSVFDETPPTEHEWTDLEIVEQIIADREYRTGNHVEDEDIDAWGADDFRRLNFSPDQAGWQY
ncbi:tigger transposable element-derived protein [Rhizoctonia solani]|uniref:Tigger transposable element-derived protein n=1 Tax=Rhizoctonia solani TaxID=456999 RepID=A0A8H8PAP0_9AGAM|nr:tigger transposable element-derived protein [Rhizoctonia solani]QRW26507.1 tigger transposable element-derived protein [Rhizoctonia solani]